MRPSVQDGAKEGHGTAGHFAVAHARVAVADERTHVTRKPLHSTWDGSMVQAPYILTSNPACAF